MKAMTTLKVLGFILATAVILFGGIGLTGAAAQSAIPGDALYPVKTTIENTRLSLAQDAGDRAQMKLAFAELRLKEITSLIREGRYREIREVVLAFEANINAAIIELETVSAADPARAAGITQEVTFALTRYAQMLSELAAVAPDSIKPEVNRALDTTQIASRLEQVNGNENTNANANDNGSIDDYAKTNENANENSDDNSNGNSNANVNANENSDDNSNGNSNANVNANDNGDDNSNGNSNANVNANDNGDDNSNGGADDNSNDDNNNDNGDDDNDDESGRGRGSDDDDDDDDNSGKGSGKDD
jgi:hypothetical protein